MKPKLILTLFLMSTMFIVGVFSQENEEKPLCSDYQNCGECIKNGCAFCAETGSLMLKFLNFDLRFE